MDPIRGARAPFPWFPIWRGLFLAPGQADTSFRFFLAGRSGCAMRFLVKASFILLFRVFAQGPTCRAWSHPDLHQRSLKLLEESLTATGIQKRAGPARASLVCAARHALCSSSRLRQVGVSLC